MSYISDKIERDAQHRYTTPIGQLASVTTITNIIDSGKSGALVGWAVRETCNYIEAQLPQPDDGANPLIGIPTMKDIIQRARKEAAKQREEAAQVGKSLHDLVEQWAKSRIAGDQFAMPIEAASDPRLYSAWEAFYKFAMLRGFRPLVSERMVYSRRHKYAGTLDIIAQGKWHRMRGPKNYLIDCKTGNVVEKTHGPQVAAYAEAYEEMTGEKVDGIAVLKLDRETGEHTWIDFTKERGKHWRVFRSAMRLYNSINSKERRGRRQ